MSSELAIHRPLEKLRGAPGDGEAWTKGGVVIDGVGFLKRRGHECQDRQIYQEREVLMLCNLHVTRDMEGQGIC